MDFLYINDNIILKDSNKEDSEIEVLDKLTFSKDDVITSSIDIKDVVTFPFKLPKSLPTEQLKTEAEIQLYENAGLDLNKKFVTFFIIKEIKNENSYLVEGIAIDEETLYQKFEPIVEKTKYIDFISLSSFSFSEFYNAYNKEAKRDAFVYLDKDQSFVVVYEKGEYLYSKILNSLNVLLKTISLEYDEFVEVISTKGVEKSNYEVDDFLLSAEIDKFFSEYFMAINNRLSYGKNIFSLENIENIYFYTPFKIEGIESLKTFWDLSGINFEIVPIQKEIGFLDKLSLLYNEKNLKNEINFSIFPRPPKFYKTQTFNLIIVIFIVFSIFGGDFGYKFYENHKLEKEINMVDKTLNIKKKKLQRLELINKVMLDELKSYNKQINEINKKKKLITKILESSLHIIEISKTSDDFVIFSKLLKKNHLQAFIISKDQNNSFQIGVYTKYKNRQYISLFMNDLYENNYKNIETDNISTLNNDYYMSTIRLTK